MYINKIGKAAMFAALLINATQAGAQGTVTSPPAYSPTYGQDRAEIEDLMARYLFAIDYFDWDAYIGTFAPDGELEFAREVTKGREAIRQVVMDFSKGIGRVYHTADGQPAKLRHVILQSSIRVEGDRAWGVHSGLKWPITDQTTNRRLALTVSTRMNSRGWMASG